MTCPHGNQKRLGDCDADGGVMTLPLECRDCGMKGLAYYYQEKIVWQVSLTKKEAVQKWNNDEEVYAVDDEGNELLIEEHDDFEKFNKFVYEKVVQS